MFRLNRHKGCFRATATAFGSAPRYACSSWVQPAPGPSPDRWRWVGPPTIINGNRRRPRFLTAFQSVV